MTKPIKKRTKNSKIQLDWATIDGILQFAATKKQCAAILEVSEDTIDRRIKEQKKMTFEDYKETKLGITKIKLQQKAIKMGLDGNPAMLIFCLKNLCGWSDKNEETHTSKIEIKIDKEDGKL